jgi:hypothetical protein
MNRAKQRSALRESLRRELRQKIPAIVKAARASPAETQQTTALRPTPPTLRGPRVILGRDSSGEPFAISDETRTRSLHVIGAPGSGKSMGMFHLLKQDILNGTGVLLLDPHGSHKDSIFNYTLRWLAATGAAQKRRVHVFDPTSSRVCGYNPLERPDDCDATVIGSAMSDAVARGFGDEDTTESPTLRRGIRAVFTAIAELHLSLLETMSMLEMHDPAGIRAWALRKLTDETARQFLERLDFLASNPRMAQTFDIETIGVRNRLEEFLSSRAIRRVFGQTKGIDLREIMDRGEIVLVSLSGGSLVSEREGDLLGRLFWSGLLFHGKRRTNTLLFAVWTDEVHRYLSGDVPNALEELRKYSIAVALGHQNVSQLGKAGDRIREAILTTPQTKVVFAINNIEEAKLLAPEVIKLPHEMVVQTLVKPTVVDHEVRLMKNGSVSQSVTETVGTGQNTMNTTTESHGNSEGGSVAHGTSEAKSHATTKGRSRAIADGFTDTTGTTHSHSTTVGTSDGVSETKGKGGGSGTGGSHTGADGSNESDNRSTSYSNTTEPMTDRWPDRTDSSGSGNGSSRSSSDSDNWSENDNWSNSDSSSHTDTYSETEGVAETESHAVSHVETNTESEGETVGTTVGINTTTGKNWASSTEHGTSRGVGSSRSQSTGRSTQQSAGVTETLVPIMANIPGSVHDLAKVTHMAAEFLNELPIGTAVVKSRINGRVVSTVVKIPKPVDYPELYPGAAKERLLNYSPLALPVDVVDREIADRHLWIKSEGAKTITPRAPAASAEPKTCRVSGERWLKNPERKKGRKPVEEV